MRSKLDLRERAWYLPILFAIPALAIFGHYIDPEAQIFKGHNWGIIVTFICLGVAGALWLPYKFQYKWGLVPTAVFLLLIGGWAYQLVSIQLDGSLFAISAGAFALSILLIWTKPPKSDDLAVSGITLGLTILMISIASLIFGEIGLLSNGFQVSDSGLNRLILTREFLGIETRWGGPFGSVNIAAPAGGMLVILGLLYHQWCRWIFILSGIGILALSQGRAAIIATSLSVIVFIAWSPLIARAGRPRLVRSAILVVTLTGAIGYVRIFDPNFALRTPIWEDFWQQFLTDPLTGVGESGIRQYLDALLLAEPERFPHNHAHSVLLDLLAKYGIVPALLLFVVFVLSLLATFKGIRNFGSPPFAIVIYVITVGLVETVYSLAYWSIHLAALLLAVMWVSLPISESLNGSRSP